MKTTIEYLESEVEELREKNENLECQVFDLEEQYKGCLLYTSPSPRD